nr:hypothetical protein [Tanacetum cinerariifolium]
MGDNSEQKVPIPKLTITRVSNQEKSPDLLSHRGFEIFQLSAKCPMMIHGKNIHVLDVPFFHFYPLNQFKYGGNWVKLSDLKQALRGRHPMLISSLLSSILENLKTLAKGFYPPSLHFLSFSRESNYEAFYFNDDHIKEISSGSTTTHSDVSLSEYDSFIFDPTHEDFADELAHIISPLEYDCFYFWNMPNPGELMSILNSGIRKNLSTTCVNLPVEDDHSPLLAYVVWIFFAYLMYPVIPPYLHSCGNKDTIFDPGITINHFYSFKPGLSHRCGAFKEFNTHRSHLNECPMIINGKNTPILDVLLFHFYLP